MKMRYKINCWLWRVRVWVIEMVAGKSAVVMNVKVNGPIEVSGDRNVLLMDAVCESLVRVQ